MRGREWLLPIYPTPPLLATPQTEKAEDPVMLTIYRRHIKTCAHRSEGRKYRRCHCPIWADGFIGREEIRETLKTRNWEEAQQKIRDWEAERSKPEEPTDNRITLDATCDKYLADAISRQLGTAAIYKYNL